VKIQMALETADGQWRVEVAQQGTRVWYRLVHNGEVVQPLAIATVQRILADNGIDMADLVEVDRAA
jgi:bifunctional non-homologous end joining protein LigD